MKKKELVVIHEFGTLIKKGQKVFLNDEEDEEAISEIAFNNLWNFILENKSSDDVEQVMSVHQKKGRQYIKCSRYVGTVQTKDGCTIEILPKIYASSKNTLCDVKTSRKVFLNMLRNFKDSDSRSFQNANLATSENFPILETYVSNYLSETENLLRTGIKKNYSRIQENAPFLKGKLLVQKQISKNVIDKVHFQIEYTKYLEDIPQNRLIVSTLHKLNQITDSNVNKARINKLLSILSDIPESSNITSDLQVSLVSNRLYECYRNLMQWSSQFLLNKGFTTFSGNHVNQALLFSAEKLFEDYVAALFKSYTRRHPGYNAYSQHTRYFLVDKHNNHGKFRIRPDIFLESTDKLDFASYENIILDTKWKIINENKPDKNYLMSISDMYQLYAYGQKYSLGEAYGFDAHPKLVLIYPATASFTKTLPAFFYEEIKKEFGLRLVVCPFDLSKTSREDVDKQIERILEEANKTETAEGTFYTKQAVVPFEQDTITNSYDRIIQRNGRYTTDRYMLIGFVKSEEHWKWIFKNNLYNVRFDERPGSITMNEVHITPSRILLYDRKGKAFLCSVNQSETFYLDNGKMEALNYPEPNGVFYKLYSIQNAEPHGKIDLDELNTKYKCNGGKPVFVKY